MNRISGMLVSVALALSFAYVPASFAGEAYAPLHKFQDKEFEGAFGTTLKEAKEMGLWPPANAADVPEKTAVAAPLYPGAEIVAIYGPSKSMEHGKFVFRGLSKLELVSTDPYEKVLSFYQEKLKGWNEKTYQNSHYFAESGEIHLNSSAMKAPHLGLIKIDGLMNRSKYTDLVPDTRTVIGVFFQDTK